MKTCELLPGPQKSTTGTYFRQVKSSLLLHTLSDGDPSESQMTNGRLLNAEARFQSQGSPYEICGGESGSDTGTSLSSSAYHRQYNSIHNYSSTINVMRMCPRSWYANHCWLLRGLDKQPNIKKDKNFK